MMLDPAVATAGRSSSARIIAVACLASAVVASGLAGIAPAIPAIQQEFSLSAAQIALVTSVYLFPSMFSSLLAGLLADRIGPRPVLAASLLVYGLGGGALLLAHSLAALLAVRFVQGVAYGAIVSLSIAVIGGVVASGPLAARAQGQRVVSMAVGEAILPVVGGLLLALTWFAPFAMQLLAVPVAVLAWFVLPRMEVRRGVAARAGLQTVLRAPALAGVQFLGAMRFVFKIGVLTYYPILAHEAGMSPVVVGLVLGAGALLAAGTASMSKRLARRWSAAQLIAGSLAVCGLSLMGMAIPDQDVILIIAMLVFSAQGGITGVAHNVLVTEMAPAEVRSTYIGLTGTVRNAGKFVAPMVLGGLTLVLTLSQGFLVLGAVGWATIGVARHVAKAQARAAPASRPPA